MNSASKKQVAQKMQKLYDNLIGYSNNAFKNSGDNILDGTSKYGWERASEAYEMAAVLLDQSLASEGIFLDSRVTDRRIFIHQEQYDSCSEDADLDITERIFHDEEV